MEKYLKSEDGELAQVAPLYGLVLTGGKSSRMKEDKGFLNYHGVSQVEYCYNLLLGVCSDVFISLREEQSSLDGYKSYPQIIDSVENAGPASGIVSALAAYPNTAWLILACDLPFVNADSLVELKNQRDSTKTATAYCNRQGDLPEPLCAIYEPSSYDVFLHSIENGIMCPRKVLMQSNTKLINQSGDGFLQNMNSPEEYRAALKIFKP